MIIEIIKFESLYIVPLLTFIVLFFYAYFTYVIAKDVNPKEVVMHIPALCEEKKVPLVIVSSKSELGAAAGIEVGTSAVAVIKEGDSKDLIKEIEKYK